jgi:hypothetical protein
MISFSRPTHGAIGVTEYVDHVDAPARRGSETVLPQIGELDAVVGKHRVDLRGDGLFQGV